MKRGAWLAGLLLIVAAVPSAPAQVPLPPGTGPNLPQVSRRMAEALRDLAEDVAAAGPASPGASPLGDCRELERAVGEWSGATRGGADPYQLRRSYSGIDLGWHRLRDRLAATGVANQAIVSEILRVDQADAAIHQALNLNAIPPNLEGQAAAPSGVGEIRRLAYTLAQRGEALSGVVRSVYPANSEAGFLANDSVELERLADAFSDLMNGQGGVPPLDQAQRAFLPVLQKSIGMGVNLDRFPMAPMVRAAWDNYTAALNLTRSSLQLAGVDPATLAAPVGAPYDPNPAAQVARWADGLDRQVDELIGNFAPTAGVVPEGREMLGEMTRLRNDVRNFRADAAQGLDPARLAFEFRDVDADWQRLARRFQPNRPGADRPEHPAGPADRRDLRPDPPGPRHARLLADDPASVIETPRFQPTRELGHGLRQGEIKLG